MLALAVMVAPAPGLASVAPPDDAAKADAQSLIEDTGRSLTLPGGDESSLWVWAKGRKAFYLTANSGNQGGSSYKNVAVIDLDTEQSVSVQAGRPVWSATWLAPGMPGTAAVDQETGRFFAAYTNQVPDVISRTGEVATGGFSCTSSSQALSACVEGFMVIDGESLATTKYLPLRLLSPQAQKLVTVPRATTFVPPAPGEPDGKLLAVLEDITTEPGFTVGSQTQPRYMETVSTYVVQFDIVSGTQEWITQVRECRGTRDGRRREISLLPYAASVDLVRSDQGDAIWVACHLNAEQQVGLVRIPVGEDGRPAGSDVRVEMPEPPSENSDAAADPQELLPQDADVREVFVGPERAFSVLWDRASGRFVVGATRGTPATQAWYVFDTRTRRYVGVVGTGAHIPEDGDVALDETTGRFYALHAEGLYVADIRLDPLPQALHFPKLAKLTTSSKDYGSFYPLAVDPEADGRPRRIIYRKALSDQLGSIVDRLPVPEPTEAPTVEGGSLDIDEVPGTTASTYDGAARGYGVRMLLLAGAEGMTRARASNPVGWARGVPEYLKATWDNAYTTLKSVGYPSRDQVGLRDGTEPCTNADREVVLGFIGPAEAAVVDVGGSRGTAVPLVLDPQSRRDLEHPVSRCSRTDWEQLWTAALFGRPPLQEPGIDEGLIPVSATCLRGKDAEAEPQSDVEGDPSSDPFFARVDCTDDEASGYSYARGGRGGAVVGEALSSYRIYRDPGRGVVSRVESVARGVNIDGLVRIDSVRGAAESWANGRKQRVAQADREPGYDPNCDMERTAGTCFRRHLFGLWTPGYACGPCGDEQAFVAAMARAFEQDAEIRLRRPDPALAMGAENGSIAAITKPLDERFIDLVINQDLVFTVVPTLEIVRYARPAHFAPGFTDYDSRSGRQVYQFAGVEVSSSYSIQCLLVYDSEKNTCAAEAEAPAELKIQLTDAAEKPLAGGGFEIREDVDADGVLGLADKLVPDGACVTTDDGTGTCSFSALKPGAYVVSQVVAPPGYAPTKEPFPVELVSGESRTVVFTNTSSLSAVNITLEGEDGRPLSGGSFAIYPDPDADGKVAPDAQPAAKCDTAADGTCSMTVPAGSYVLVQTAAPDGLEPIEPVPFVISSGGQVAAVEAVNYPFGAPPEAAPAASPSFTYQPPPAELPPELHTVPLPTMGIPQDQPEVAPQESAAAVVGNTVERIVRAPGDVLRLLARSPAEAVAFAAAGLLFALACAAIDRRRKLLALTATG